MKPVKKSYDEESYELDNVYNETDDRYYYGCSGFIHLVQLK